MKKALIIGINSQIGIFLSQVLIENNYKVYGTINCSVDKIITSAYFDKLIISKCNLENTLSIVKILDRICPDEIYLLAAQTNPAESWLKPQKTLEVNFISVIPVLEWLRSSSNAKLLFTSSAEVYETSSIINEDSLTHPSTPYGLGKAAASEMINLYRARYNVRASIAILFNNDSRYRTENYVLPKVIKTLQRIRNGSNEILKLGNLDTKRSWGLSSEFSKAIFLINQAGSGHDFIVSSSHIYSIKEVVEKVCCFFTLELEWHNKEIGFSKKLDRKIIEVSNNLIRKDDKSFDFIDCSKLKEITGWEHSKDFNLIIEEIK